MKYRIPNIARISDINSEIIPEYKPKNSETYQVKVITPIYGGGVKAGEPDKDMPIRASAIRGQLRYWWHPGKKKPSKRLPITIVKKQKKICLLIKMNHHLLRSQPTSLDSPHKMQLKHPENQVDSWALKVLVALKN